MQLIDEYLTAHQPLFIFLCLGLGYIVGIVRIKSFRIGATAGTLLVGLIISQFGSFDLAQTVKTLSFSLFCFTIGFDVGPAFFASMRSSGIRIFALSIFFAAVGLGAAYGFCTAFGLDEGTATGVLAGALTQTSILNAANLADGLSDNATAAYALTYVFGTLGVILFLKSAAPRLLRVRLGDEVKAKIDRMGGYHRDEEGGSALQVIQMRAFEIQEGAAAAGNSVDWFEGRHSGKIEVEAVYRGDYAIPFSQKTELAKGDVILLIGNFSSLAGVYMDRMAEVSDPKYHQIKMKSAEIVLTGDCNETCGRYLSENCIMLNSVAYNGRRRKGEPVRAFSRGNILSVVGPERAVQRAAKAMGYLKDTGSTTDIAFMMLAIVVGLFVGTLSVALGKIPLSLGETGGALISGLLCGYWYYRRPRFGHIPDATRWFLKSVGLNLYIAVLALHVGKGFLDAMRESGWLILLAGALVTILPHLLTLYFGKYALRLDVVDVLGGQCGCGTCTAALNALTEETNSSVFALSYAPGYAVGNVLLTFIGLLLPLLMR